MGERNWIGWKWCPVREVWERVPGAKGATMSQAHQELNKRIPPMTPNRYGALTSGAAPDWKP